MPPFFRFLDSACKWFLQEAGVEAIMPGGTDLALVYKESRGKYPVVDCAAVHVNTIVRYTTQG